MSSYSFSNAEIAKKLRNVAAAYIIRGAGNIFQIRAYENAASSIEHSTAEIYDLWQENKLDQVSALGSRLQEYLNELFTTGEVKHFKTVIEGIPDIVFTLLDISGIGPKTAQSLASLGVKDLVDLKEKIESDKLVQQGFSAKIAQKILSSLKDAADRKQRMLLPYAFAQAEKILNYLTANPHVPRADFLGSLRRMVATVGDLDFAVSSKKSREVVEYFCQMPGVKQIIDKGENKAAVLLRNGLHVDLLVGEPDSYGALLQHFTGSKSHNIKLRELANNQGYSLSEYGAKKLQNKQIIHFKTERQLYDLLKMQLPPPEIRENTGEVEAALEHRLPNLIKHEDIKGDIHLHSNYPISNPSHGPGVSSIEEIVKKAQELGYQYAGIADHPPGLSAVTKEQMISWTQKRTKFIQFLASKTKSIRVLNGLEIDILGNGSLSVPDEALVLLDFCIAGIHSGHRGSKEKITSRLKAALENPHVDIISHPTNRLLNQRESSEADWEEIFRIAASHKKILEINAYPDRLDLRDDLVRQALKFGVKFIINTDAHEISQMENMKFGVAVARRGWATRADITNSWIWTEFAKWFKIRIS